MAGSTSCNNCPANYDTAGVTGQTACTGTPSLPARRAVRAEEADSALPRSFPQHSRWQHALPATPATATVTPALVRQLTWPAARDAMPRVHLNTVVNLRHIPRWQPQPARLDPRASRAVPAPVRSTTSRPPKNATFCGKYFADASPTFDVAPLACPVNTYSAAGDAMCTLCPAGKDTQGFAGRGSAAACVGKWRCECPPFPVSSGAPQLTRRGCHAALPQPALLGTSASAPAIRAQVRASSRAVHASGGCARPGF